MIWVIGDVEGRRYREPFSKGILARSLSITDVGSERAYEIASEIESKLIDEDISEITLTDLTNFIVDYLDYLDPDYAKKYLNWREVRKSKEPLIILIGGASGVGTSSMAFELASKLGLKNLISTDMIREVMRKIVSKELSPVIHKSSFDAYESIRIPSIRIDSVIEGFISHVEVVNVGVEAIIERSLKEGISIIIEGVHVVPGFIRKDLINKNNIIIFTLVVDDPETHKQRFFTRCRQPWVKRSLEKYIENFDIIRKTQDFLIEQAKIHDSCIIDNIDVTETVDIMVNEIIEKYGGLKNVEQKSE